MASLKVFNSLNEFIVFLCKGNPSVDQGHHRGYFVALEEEFTADNIEAVHVFAAMHQMKVKMSRRLSGGNSYLTTFYLYHEDYYSGEWN